MLSSEEIKGLQRWIANDGDERAFGQLYMAFMPKLLQFAMSIVKNKELAEEVVSDVFIKLWQNKEKLLEVENLKLYLYVSTKNTSLNYLSRHFRKDILPIDEMDIKISSLQFNPEQTLLTTEMINKINAAINNLPPKCKVIFKLAKEDGLKYKEIAHLLNISVKTIDNQIIIALKKISAAVNFSLEGESQKLF